MMTTTDTRDLLAAIAEHDGREITELAVESWQLQADRGDWTRDTALEAVADYYRQQPAWEGTQDPRPVLPADIHRRFRRMNSYFPVGGQLTDRTTP